jgi:hypothetical protein
MPKAITALHKHCLKDWDINSIRLGESLFHLLSQLTG